MCYNSYSLLFFTRFCTSLIIFACLVRFCCINIITVMVVIVADDERTATRTYINFSVWTDFDAPYKYHVISFSYLENSIDSSPNIDDDSPFNLNIFSRINIIFVSIYKSRGGIF